MTGGQGRLKGREDDKRGVGREARKKKKGKERKRWRVKSGI